MCLSPDGRTLTASTGKGLYTWDIASGHTLSVHEDIKLGPTALSPDGTLLVTGRPMQVLQPPDDHALCTVTSANNPLAAVFSPDGQILAIAQVDQTVLLWNTRSRQDVVTLKGHKDRLLALSFHPDGRTLASGSQDGKAILWDTATGTATKTFDGGNSVAALAFSPSGKTLAAGLGGGSSSSSNDTVRLWPVP
jgi:WD40 repeat protein